MIYNLQIKCFLFLLVTLNLKLNVFFFFERANELVRSKTIGHDLWTIQRCRLSTFICFLQKETKRLRRRIIVHLWAGKGIKGQLLGLKSQSLMQKLIPNICFQFGPQMGRKDSNCFRLFCLFLVSYQISKFYFEILLK